MTEKPSPERESHDSGADSGESPMANFVNLARRLVNVPPAKIAEEQAKYDAEEDRKKRPRLQSS